MYGLRKNALPVRFGPGEGREVRRGVLARAGDAGGGVSKRLQGNTAAAADEEKQPAAAVQLILAAFQKIGYPPPE